MKQIWSHNEIEDLKKSLAGRKIVLVGGCFDLIHYGHFTFLQKAKEAGDVLVVALEPDEFIQKRKNRKPVHTQKQRAEILGALQPVDYVLLLPFYKTDSEYSNLVQTLSPHVVAVTEGDNQHDSKKKQVELVNGSVKVVSTLLPEFSTSKIVTYENISRS